MKRAIAVAALLMLGAGTAWLIVTDSSLSGNGSTASPLKVNTAVIQARVSGSCGAGSAIRVVAADGTVTCAAAGTGTVTSVTSTALDGITVANSTTTPVLSVDNTILQTRVSSTCTSPNSIDVVNADGTVTCTTGVGSSSSVAGTTGDLASFSSSSAVGNYAGSSPSACGAGNALTRVVLAATGAATLTCAPFGSSSLTNAAGANVTTKSDGTNLVAAWPSDDATTWGVSGKFAITEADGSVLAGTLGSSFHQLNGSLVDSQAIGTTVASASGANFRAADTTSMAQGVGGAVVFRGNYTGTTPTHGASIKMMKSTATDAETAFDLVFATRPAGGSAELEACRVKSDQSVLFAGAVSVAGVTTVTGGITGLTTTSCGAGSAMTSFGTTGAGTCNPFLTSASSISCSQLPALTGDVTSSACATTIAANAVTRADMATGAAISVIGRSANSIGNVADIAATAVGQVLGVTGSSMLAFSAPTSLEYGPGTDGPLTYDGSTTVLGMAPSSSVYTLTRPVFGTTIAVSTGVTIKLNGYWIQASGTLTLTGTANINDNGNAGTNASGAANGVGGANRATGWYVSSGGGGNAGSGGTGSTNQLPVPWGSTLAASSGGAVASAGATGGLAQGGGGGGAGLTNAGNTGGATTAAATSGGTGAGQFWPMINQSRTGFAFNTVLSYASGGGSGGSLAGLGAGGGGAGAGIAFVRARIIAGAGTITATGGNGGNGAGGTGSAGGGGGGGGGGYVVVYYQTNSGTVTATAAGGTHGTGGTGTAGSGGNGGDGGAGKVFDLNQSGDGTHL